MTETDFFRIARERMGDYSIAITRCSQLGKKAYSVALLREGKTLYSEAETLPDALADLMYRSEVDRRAAPRGPVSTAASPEDRKWPRG